MKSYNIDHGCEDDDKNNNDMMTRMMIENKIIKQL